MAKMMVRTGGDGGEARRIVEEQGGRVAFDDSLDVAVATGDLRTYFVDAGGGDPLAVTLAWRDAPGSPLQNVLHLRMVHVATGDTSSSDDVLAIRDNVQKVVLPNPAPGLYRIEVEGVEVVEGVPELAPSLRQDYALVVSGATPSLRPSA